MRSEGRQYSAHLSATHWCSAPCRLRFILNGVVSSPVQEEGQTRQLVVPPYHAASMTGGASLPGCCPPEGLKELVCHACAQSLSPLLSRLSHETSLSSLLSLLPAGLLFETYLLIFFSFCPAPENLAFPPDSHRHCSSAYRQRLARTWTWPRWLPWGKPWWWWRKPWGQWCSRRQRNTRSRRARWWRGGREPACGWCKPGFISGRPAFWCLWRTFFRYAEQDAHKER